MPTSNTHPAILDHNIDGSSPTDPIIPNDNNALFTVALDSSNLNQEVFKDNIQIIDGSMSLRRKKFKDFFNSSSFIWLALLLVAIIVISIAAVVYRKGKEHTQKSKETESNISNNATSIDGIPADVIEAVSVTNIKKIAKLGRYKKAFVGGIKDSYSQTPTVSAPGYMNLITGTWANKHNVFDNDVHQPNYHYKNIFRLLKEQQPQRKIAIFSTWIDNRLKLVGEGLSKAGTVIFDYKFDGYELNLVDFWDDGNHGRIHKVDEHVINETATCIRTYAPDLSWVYLQYTDDVAHKYGDSEQFNQSVLILDNQVGRVWEAIQYRENNFHEDWMLIITTDHGRDPISGRNHGDQSDRERTTWIVMNKDNTNEYFDTYQPAIVDLLPTMARFLDIFIPIESARELDGIPLTGNVSLAKLKASLTDDLMFVSWKALENVGNVTIWLSTTNLFRNGTADDYQFMGTVSIDLEIITISVKAYPSNFYKIVVVGLYNMVNTWVFRKN